MKKINEYGITLIALTITIILILILAGITINTLSNNGIFERAKEARDRYKNAQEEENIVLNDYIKDIDSYIGMSRDNMSVTTLYETDTASSTITLSESYKNFNIIYFFHTDNSYFGYLRSSSFPTLALSKIQTENVLLEIYGSRDNLAGIKINSDTEFYVDNGNEKIYAIYGIK